jgi:hypothetical protein
MGRHGEAIPTKEALPTKEVLPTKDPLFRIAWLPHPPDLQPELR